jgi:hypothetical protein
MPIRPASEVSFSPLPHCPECGAGILPYGRREPLVVGAAGQVYCRDHGGTIEPSYPEVLSAYRKKRMDKRQAALQELAEMNASEAQASSR